MLAYGELTITAEDVYNALTQPKGTWYSERELNNKGKQLADLIAERIMVSLAAKLTGKPEDSDE